MSACDECPLEFFGVDIDSFEIQAALRNCEPMPATYVDRRQYPFVCHLFEGSILQPTENLREKDGLVCIEV